VKVKNLVILGHDRVQFWAFGDTVIKLMVPSKQAISFLIG
jgi:hypothetical protein